MKSAKKSWLLLGLLLASGVLFTPSIHATPVQWADNGHWYDLVLDTSSSWDQANAIATSSGGYLVTITSAPEQAFIESLLSSSGCPSGGYWMGLKLMAPNVFGWANSETSSYTNWHLGEPNNGWNGDEDRGQIIWTSDADYQRENYYRRGQWNDIRNIGWALSDTPPGAGAFVPYDLPRTGFIIESVPEPSSMGFVLIGSFLFLFRRIGKRFDP